MTYIEDNLTQGVMLHYVEWDEGDSHRHAFADPTRFAGRDGEVRGIPPAVREAIAKRIIDEGHAATKKEPTK